MISDYDVDTLIICLVFFYVILLFLLFVLCHVLVVTIMLLRITLQAVWGEHWVELEATSKTPSPGADFLTCYFLKLSYIEILVKSNMALFYILKCCASPNDPIFMLHHINLDRYKTAWMIANSDSATYFYGFSTVGNLVKGTGTVYSGIGLNDYVSSAWGFTDTNLGISAHSSSSSLWTHADALCYLQPTTAPYTYDDYTNIV